MAQLPRLHQPPELSGALKEAHGLQIHYLPASYPQLALHCDSGPGTQSLESVSLVGGKGDNTQCYSRVDPM